MNQVNWWSHVKITPCQRRQRYETNIFRLKVGSSRPVIEINRRQGWKGNSDCSTSYTLWVKKRKWVVESREGKCWGEEGCTERRSHRTLMCLVASSRCTAWTDARFDGPTLEKEGKKHQLRTITVTEWFSVINNVIVCLFSRTSCLVLFECSHLSHN